MIEKADIKSFLTAHTFSQNEISKNVIYALKLINICVSPSLPAGVC
jgi:hypothetical protein